MIYNKLVVIKRDWVTPTDVNIIVAVNIYNCTHLINIFVNIQHRLQVSVNIVKDLKSFIIYLIIQKPKSVVKWNGRLYKRNLRKNVMQHFLIITCSKYL